MATNCFLETLSEDILNDCENFGKLGIEPDIIIIPRKHIDFSASAVDDENRMIVKDIVLKDGETGYLFESVKQLSGFESEFVPSDDTLDRWKHTFNGVILTPSAENRLEHSKLAKGEQYVVVIHRKYKGKDQKDAFLVLGWDTGLYFTEGGESSSENDGGLTFTLSNKDNELEDEEPRNLLDEDYETTLTAFNNKFEADAA